MDSNDDWESDIESDDAHHEVNVAPTYQEPAEPAEFDGGAQVEAPYQKSEEAEDFQDAQATEHGDGQEPQEQGDFGAENDAQVPELYHEEHQEQAAEDEHDHAEAEQECCVHEDEGCCSHDNQDFGADNEHVETVNDNYDEHVDPVASALGNTEADEAQYDVADALENALETRPSEEQLEHVGIQRTKRGSVSDLLAGTAVELEKHMTQDKINHALEHRPSEQALESAGLMKTKRGSMSDVLASTAVQLEKEMKADVVSASLHKRTSELGFQQPPMKKRSSLSNVLAAPAKELEKQMLVDNVSAGLSRRSSKQELLDRGVLKRPPSESKIIAASAVALEKALTSDRVSGKIATTIQAYLGVEQADSATGSLSLKDRTDAYMKAIRDANAAPAVAPGIRQRMRAFEEAAKSSPPPKSSSSVVMDAESMESKTMESPQSSSSLKDRLFAYQDAAAGKMSPKTPTIDGPSLKERLALYQESANSSSVKKQVEIDVVGTVNNKLTNYMDVATSPREIDTESEKM